VIGVPLVALMPGVAVDRPDNHLTP
jgi:hypothetical protein